MDGQMGEQIDRCMDGLMIDTQMDRQMDRYINVWTDGWINRSKDGLMNRCRYIDDRYIDDG